MREISKIIAVILSAVCIIASPLITVWADDEKIDDNINIKILTPTAVKVSNMSYTLNLNDILTEIAITPNLTNSNGFNYPGYGNRSYAYSASNRLMLYTYSDGSIGYAVGFPFDVWDKTTKTYYPAGSVIRWSDLSSRSFLMGSTASQEMKDIKVNTIRAVTTALNIKDIYNQFTTLTFKPFTLASQTWNWSGKMTVLQAKPGSKHNDQAITRYMAYDDGPVTINPAVSDTLIVGGDPVDANRSGAIWMGEDVDFYFDTTGAFAGDDCYVEITPSYKVLDINGNVIDAGLYTNIEYSLFTGFLQHSVDLTEHSAKDDPTNHGHRPITYSAITSLDAKPTAAERTLTSELFGKTAFNATRWYDKIILNSESKFIRESAPIFSKYPFLEDAVKTDNNHDNYDDGLQKTLVRWYGAISIPSDTIIVRKDLRYAQCPDCNRCCFNYPTNGNTFHCNSCKKDFTATAQVFTITPATEDAIFSAWIDPYLITEGYVEISLSAKVVDCAGNVTTIDKLKLKDRNGNNFVLRYKLGTSAANKWVIEY